MDLRIREADLVALHVWHASMVMLARPGEKVGISVYEMPALATSCDLNDYPYHLLVIEVEDPWDGPTQARIRASLSGFNQESQFGA